jgi:asparagine synthetase B (glutamine-hydrolysing)
MAKFILVCARDGAPLPETRVRKACASIVPDNIRPRPPDVRTRAGLVLAIVSPTTSLPVHETSLCLGQMLGRDEGWWVPETAPPDGTFALVRSDDGRVEVATDAVASRSVFYAATDDLFVASTSQRAIVSVLGGFRLNPAAVSWMLSSGALGPGNGWDARIRRLGADERVSLDRAAWRVTSRRRPIVFEPDPVREEEHADRLREAVLRALDGLDVTRGEWRLPLSGGQDSRLILARLSRRHPVSCITWGVPSALADPENDAYIARKLAQAMGVPHAYFQMDVSSEPPDVLFERFLVNGEGCVDHFSAYTDGFEVWRRLHDDGIAGVIRGDEGFGWEPVAVEADVRYVVGAPMLRDCYSADRLRALGLAEQTWPTELRRATGESIATWRDRLYHAFRIPVILASLTDLKTPYVEIVNPYLSRRVLEAVRALPDSLRTNKKLFRRLVESLSPSLPFATRSAIPNLGKLVERGALRELTRRELLAAKEEGSLPAPFVDHVTSALAAAGADGPATGGGATRGRIPTGLGKEYLLAALRKLPPGVRSVMRSIRPRPPSPAQLAFRGAIVSRMARTLARDGASA